MTVENCAPPSNICKCCVGVCVRVSVRQHSSVLFFYYFIDEASMPKRFRHSTRLSMHICYFRYLYCHTKQYIYIYIYSYLLRHIYILSALLGAKLLHQVPQKPISAMQRVVGIFLCAHDVILAVTLVVVHTTYAHRLLATLLLRQFGIWINISWLTLSPTSHARRK